MGTISSPAMTRSLVDSSLISFLRGDGNRLIKVMTDCFWSSPIVTGCS